MRTLIPLTLLLVLAFSLTPRVAFSEGLCADLPLRLAAADGDYERIDKLFAHDCNVNSSAHGNPVFTVAARSGASLFFLEYLRVKGADLKKTNSSGLTVYDYFKDEKTHRSLTYLYLEALKERSSTAVSTAFEKRGVLVEKSKCVEIGHSYQPEEFYVPRIGIDQKPNLKNQLIIEAIISSELNRPDENCPKSASHFFIEATHSILKESGNAYQVIGLRVHCCK